MTLQYWDYDPHDDTITFKLDTGGKIACDMRHEVLRYGCQLEREISFSDDGCKDMCFMLYGLHYTALQVIQWARADR